MPRIFGTPSAKAATLIRNRSDLNKALRNDDQKLLLGVGDAQDDVFSNMLGMTSVVPGVQTNRFVGYGDYLGAGTKKVWATGRCCELMSGVFISTEMRMVKRGDISRRGVPKIDPLLALLLANPNPHETISEFLWVWVWQMVLTGNVFWLKDQMNALGQPMALYNLNPRFMVIVPDKRLKVAKYIYRVNGNEIEFDPDEIIHFKRPHPNDPLWGLGQVEAGESLYNDHINRQLYNVRLMANGAFPTSMLIKEDFDGSPDEWELIKNGFNDRYAGVNNSGKVAFGNGKWNVLRLGMDANTMQEIEKSTRNVEEIFVNHGVPLSVAGFGAANYATSRQDDINFRRYAILPLLNLFADTINSPRGFVMSFDKSLKLDFSLSGIIDVEQVNKECEPLLRNGAMTQNEWRERIGMQRSSNPFLDQFYITNGLVPIEVAGIAPEDSAEPELNSNPGQDPDTDPDAPVPDDGKPKKKPKR